MKVKKNKSNKIKILFFGTYDLSKPRVRLLIKGAKAAGFNIIECHKDIWSNVRDKSQIKGFYKKLFFLFSWMFSYFSLIKQYFKAPDHDFILVPYMGQLDVLIIWPFAKLKRKPIVWDVFISLYDTIVNDRKLISKRSLLAHIIYFEEWLASRAADFLFLDTKSHANYFADLFKISPKKIGYVFVGAETDKFYPKKVNLNESLDKHFTILFYGQFIPLHGIETIVYSAKLLSNENIKFIIIGEGQESVRIDNLIKKMNLKNIKRISWVPYSDLIDYINYAHICLGIFGNSEKAKRVIPNKVYQILSCKRPIITANTLAIKELIDFLGFSYPLIFLVPPKNPEALAEKILLIRKQYQKIITDINNLSFSPINSKTIGDQLTIIAKQLLINKVLK